MPRSFRKDIKKLSSEKKKRIYRGLRTKHWILDSKNGGCLIKLDDGSLWHVSSYYTYYSKSWVITDDIIVRNSDNHLFPYLLVNKSRGTTAKAQYIATEVNTSQL